MRRGLASSMLVIGAAGLAAALAAPAGVRDHFPPSAGRTGRTIGHRSRPKLTRPPPRPALCPDAWSAGRRPSCFGAPAHALRRAAPADASATSRRSAALISKRMGDQRRRPVLDWLNRKRRHDPLHGAPARAKEAGGALSRPHEAEAIARAYAAGREERAAARSKERLAREPLDQARGEMARQRDGGRHQTPAAGREPASDKPTPASAPRKDRDSAPTTAIGAQDRDQNRNRDRDKDHDRDRE